MARSSRRKHGRIKRGDNIAPGRYWLAFMFFSIAVHAVTLTLMSDAALSFIQSLRKPEPPAPRLTYVSLFYTSPAPLPAALAPIGPAAPAVPAAQAKTVTKAPAAPVPVRAPRPARPAEQVQLNTSAEDEAAEGADVKADTHPPAASGDDVLLHVKVSGVTHGRIKEKPRTVPERKPLDTAIRETAVLDSVEAGTVQLITGTKKTTLALNDIAKQRPARTEPPAVLNRYSSVRMSDAATAHLAATTPAVNPDYSVVTRMPAKQINIARPAQPATPDNKAAGVPPVQVLSSPSPVNTGTLANAATPTATQPDNKAPLPPLPQVAFKGHTTTPPSPVAVPTHLPAAGDDKAAVILAAQPVKPPAQPSPAPPKVITVRDSENVGKPPKIKITTPREGTTDKSLVDIAGEVEGDTVKSVSLSIRDEKRELLVRDGVFKTTAQLEEGKNEVKATASDLEGRAASDSISVTYVPAITAPRITFISPVKDGVIDAMATDKLLISGVVEGKDIGTVRVYLNKTVMDIPVKGGRFNDKVPLEAEHNVLYAEATDKSLKTYRSEKIAFHVLNLYPKDLTVRVEYSGTGAAGLKYRFRPHPLPETAGNPQAAPEFLADSSPSGGAVSVGEAAPGIYTVGVEYDTGPGEVREATFKVTLYGYDPSRKKTRTIGPVKLRGKGYLPAVRVLLPEEVFWEDDSWFTGRMDSGQGTMKYREPGGIVWKEEE